MSRGRPKPSLRSLSKTQVNLSDTEHINELVHGTDRCAALVGAAAVDAALVTTLGTFLIDLGDKWRDKMFYDQDAAVSNFSARIRLGRALGVYDDQFMGFLDIIRQVRNAFAHSPAPLTFQHPLVVVECIKLPLVPMRQDIVHKMSPERTRYVTMCHVLASMLNEVGNHTSKQLIDIWINNGYVTPPASLEKPAQQQLPDSQNPDDTNTPPPPQLAASGE